MSPYNLPLTFLFLSHGIVGWAQQRNHPAPSVVAISDNGRLTGKAATEEWNNHSVYQTVAGFVTILPG